MGTLKELFDPRSIALIGASEREGSVGRTVLENLLLAKDRRKIYPINPKAETVLGQKSYPDIGSIPEAADLAVISTPAPSVPAIVDACGKAGVSGLVIISAGFREIGEEGKRLEAEIQNARRRYGMRIVGPNCLGFIRPGIALNATFIKAMPEQGKIAFISHSGALGSAILDWAMDAGIGFSMFVSLGSMIDVDFGDLIDFLGTDPATRSILIYMEGVGQAKKFMSAARGFARTKPIIILKPGRFQESAKAAQSHTGALTGDDEIYDAAFKRAGVVRVEGIDDLFSAASVLDSKHLPRGARLVIVTNAGGPGAITTDCLVGLGGQLASLSEETIHDLNSFLPPYWSHGNPVDVLGDADVDRYQKAVDLCLDDPNVDGILLLYTPQGMVEPKGLAEGISEIAKRAWKPLLTTFMGGSAVAEARDVFIANSIPTYDTPEKAVKIYMAMHRYQRNLELLYQTPAELPVNQAPPKNSLKALVRSICRRSRYALTEEESKRFLVNYGIPTTMTRLARSIEEARDLAHDMSYPVALKIVSPEILHKSDVGGVVLNVRSEQELTERYEALISHISEVVPHATITGVSVQQMVSHVDYEVILGAKKDKDWGSVILFGMGGVGTEIFRDFSIGLPPLNQTLARRLMEETKVFKMLKGYRGRQPADLKQLEQIVVAFSELIVDFPEINEMDINPIAISGGIPIALDARIIIDPNCVENVPPYPHLVITPYPSRYVIPWTLEDGTAVILRPIRPEDEPLEHSMLETLSQDTVRGRFFQSIKNLSHAELTRFCNIDYDREMALVAELREGRRRRLIGVSRLIMDPDFRSGEFAVLIHDDYQNKRLGSKLLDMLIGIAMEKHMQSIYGIVLSDNKRMLYICYKAGFTATPLPEGLTRVELDLT